MAMLSLRRYRRCCRQKKNIEGAFFRSIIRYNNVTEKQKPSKQIAEAKIVVDMDGFKHLDLQQCEKFKEFGAPEFHHDCARELEIHTMADSNSGTPIPLISHTAKTTIKGQEYQFIILKFNRKIYPSIWVLTDLTVSMYAFNADSGHQTSFMVCDRV
ncbi:hypothetical protein D0Y65_006239 [Glycine soja]|uniref:Uncharacterized protein n=1 Tax=Glycine soja TaxID=3848 RepID=A0A445L8B6_GLYSO|nr:hypothetical protein D0Y65_006239 [Glycine soja]